MKTAFLVLVLFSQVGLAFTSKMKSDPPVKELAVTSIVVSDDGTKLFDKEGKETATIGTCPNQKEDSDTKCVITKNGYAAFDSREEAGRAISLLSKNQDPGAPSELLLDLKNHIVLRVQSASAK